MYNESKSFSLLRIIVKVIIIFIFIMLAIWLISKVVNKTSNNVFEKNMNVMKEASIEYFKKGNLPKEEGDVKKVTLGDLIKMKYISSFDKKCDRDKSYSQATLVDDYYALRVELLCGNKKDYIYTSIDKDGNCVGDNCDAKKEEKKDEKKDSNDKKDVDNNSNNEKIENDSSAKNDSNSSNNGKTLYYEHVKVDKVYTDWSSKKISGDNVETKQQNTTLNKYCRVLSSEYYVVTYYSKYIELGRTYKIVIRLDNIPSNTTYLKVVNSNLFGSDYDAYDTYLSTSPKVTFISGNNGYNMLNNCIFLEKSSVKNSNASINSVSFENTGSGAVLNILVNINNFDGIFNYKGVHFVPIYIKVNYADESSCVNDSSSNASKYSGYNVVGTQNSSVTLYRSYSYKKDENNKKWSTSKSIEGYTLTGKTEYR